MKRNEVFFNPFRMLSPKLDRQALRMEDLYKEPVSQKITLEEGVLVMISKLIEMARLLSKAFVSGSPAQMDRCEALAAEVDEQEDVLTKGLVSAQGDKNVIKGVIRFPYRLERIGDMLESMLRCCRTKAKRGIPFSDKAHSELDQLFTLLLGMLTNLRDAFTTPNQILLDSIVEDSKKLYHLIEDFKLAHWARLEAGICHVEASSVYRDILDSAKMSGEYVEKMCTSLVDLDKEAV
jgi:Na+/phosphate symporter